MASLRSLKTGPHREVRKSPGDTAVDGRVADLDDVLQPRDTEPSREVLVEALQHADKGSDLEKALVWALEQRGKVASGGGGDDGVSPRLAIKIAAAIIAALSFIQPTVSQFAERVLSPSSALERKLDDVLTIQTELQQRVTNDSATVIALAKWVVSCEIARDRGFPQPELPAAVKLILVQDELARSTGP